MSYKILSLDGGGTWALIQARVLAKRYGEDAAGHDVLKKYDLAIANSGGSLVLAMLCANARLSEIVSTFEDTRVLKEIFKDRIVDDLPLIGEILPRFRTENKYKEFRKNLNRGGVAYGDKLLTELPALIGKPSLQIVITAFDYDRERATYFRSNENSKMESRWIEEQVSGHATDVFKTCTLAQAVHAASNAPVQYFKDPAEFRLTADPNGARKETSKRLFWDGAVGGNNNPVKSGVLEALANGVKREDIQIVTIGTANTVKPVLYGEQNECEPAEGQEFLCRKSKMDGLVPNLQRMATSILSDPPDAATFDTHQILGLEYKQNDWRLIRINPLVKPIRKGNTWTMPGNNAWDVNDMKDLFDLDMAVSTKEGVRLINRMCNDFFAGFFDNQGVRTGGKNMDSILGHKLFADAMHDWNSDKWS